MDWDAFFFSFETVLPERTLEAASGGIPEWGGQASQRPLAVPGVIVQNGRAQSCLTHRAATTDRAEIGQINGVVATSRPPTRGARDHSPLGGQAVSIPNIASGRHS